MHINSIQVNNFRNYEMQEIELSPNINIFYGDNAAGKTSILEAIFVCSLTKSFRTNKDKELINKEKKNAKLEIKYDKIDRSEKIRLELNEKKSFFINDIIAKKTSDVLGNLFVVLFTPEDISVLKEEPGKRRKFLNIMISQLRPIYLHTLSQYNKVMEQRNCYLRQIKFENKKEDLLDIWDEKLVELGTKIYYYRKEFIEKINIKIKEIHLKTTSNQEVIKLKYISNIENEEKYLEKMKLARNNDIIRGTTSIGIHRDDFISYINDNSIAVYGSQGQARTAVISLKLAEKEIIFEEIGEYPIVLLDDFMSELDTKRIKGFLENIKDNQVIITCTDNFKISNSKYNLYKVTNGNIEKVWN